MYRITRIKILALFTLFTPLLLTVFHRDDDDDDDDGRRCDATPHRIAWISKKCYYQKRIAHTYGVLVRSTSLAYINQIYKINSYRR